MSMLLIPNKVIGVRQFTAFDLKTIRQFVISNIKSLELTYTHNTTVMGSTATVSFDLSNCSVNKSN